MPKVLLVEDDEMNADMMSRWLGRRGFEVVVGTNGRAAVQLAQSEAPELIIMDMTLPVLTGWEASEEIKASPATKHIPILALTAHATADDRKRALEAGCDDFGSKPVELAKLAEKINALLYPSGSDRDAEP